MRILSERRAGVLLHPTSLPGAGKHGRLGPDAFRFVDFLSAGGFTVWQTLPLGPADAFGSPYSARSVHAGNPELIDARTLADREELPAGLRVEEVSPAALLDAYRRFRALATACQSARFASFVRKHRRWLLPYALFELYGRRFSHDPWWRWPREIRERSVSSLRRALAEHQPALRSIAFGQYLFTLQWNALKRYANAKGICLFGDMPLYVDLNSVEVWWRRALFRVDGEGRPEALAGVPPDYFSSDGQLWGNPLYDWKRMEQEGFRWWIERLRSERERFDLIRLDHFRGLQAYWEVPASAATARAGRWRPAPGAALLSALRGQLGEVALIAEDLGVITPEVRALRERFALPGMIVLQFAFDGSPDNPHLPKNHRRDAVLYTGTHDNDTIVGWYASLSDETRAYVAECLGATEPLAPAVFLDAVYASPAQLAVIPMQDLLGLGSEARMNTPGTTRGNWSWRFRWSDLPSSLCRECAQRAERTGRLMQRPGKRP